MSGILNNKERMIDFIITKMGRQQMSSGRMRIEFATLTDRHTFYQASGSEGVAEDASNRLYFEASERQQDIIVPELEDGHVMNPFRVGNLQISGKEFASGTFQKVGPVGVTTTFSGSEIVDNARLLTRGLASHWRDQKILGTKDFFSDKSGFVVNAHTASFVIADSTVENDRDPENAWEPRLIGSYEEPFRQMAQPLTWSTDSWEHRRGSALQAVQEMDHSAMVVA